MCDLSTSKTTKLHKPVFAPRISAHMLLDCVWRGLYDLGTALKCAVYKTTISALSSNMGELAASDDNAG